MHWTAQGPYVTSGNSTAVNANNIEAEYTEAILSIEQHLLTLFVLVGGVCTIHGGSPKQLDFTAIDAFLKQPVDASGQNTIRWRHVAAGNSTSATASSTYFLDLNPDGTMSWATSHSGTANYLPICSVTTDGSQNLLVITDARGINTTLLSGMAGRLTLPNLTPLKDRKSTRLNSSHQIISYAVFCLKKKKTRVLMHSETSQKL